MQLTVILSNNVYTFQTKQT